MTTDRHDEHGVLEHNVSTLLESGGERPQIAEAARARIRAELVAAYGTAGARPRRSPVAAVGLGLAGLAAAAAVVALVGRLSGDAPAPAPGMRPLAFAGAEVIEEPGARVTELSARHLRVEGAALIDVAPGKGPFVVETAHGRIEVLGTKFLVDGERDWTIAAVVRGQVRLLTDRGDVVLHAGEQGVAEPGHPPVRGPAPRLSHLASWAQEARHRDEHAAPVHHGTLFARDPGVRSHPPWGEEYPLPIARLGLDVVVEDQVARVAIDQTFHNPANQALEGVYRFAIPPDAALQRLAMYVDGKLTESAVVERMAARRIYEQLVYRRVDPALLEWAGTGRLALRVYPIPALSDKRLMVAYTQSLPKLYSDFTLAIPLPEVDQPVGAMEATVRVKGCANCELSSPSHRIEVAREGDDAIVRYRRAGETIGDSFVLHVRDARVRTTVAEAEQGGERYLMVRAPGELATGPVRYRPRTWVILDDVSASRGRLELRAQADVVDALLRELDEDDRASVIAFDVEARTHLAPTRVRDVDRRAVRQALGGEGGVGATDVGAALDAALAALAGVDPDDAMIVYLGDGVITSGARNLDALRARIAGKARFVGVGIGDGPDTQTLQGLAAATGGYATAIDLADDLGWRTFDLVAALHTARITGLDARLVDAHGQRVPSTVYLASPQLADGEELELVARLAGDGTPAAVELTGIANGAPWRKTIALDAPGAAHDRSAGYLPRLWAQRHIAARLLAKHEPVVVPPCSPAPASRGKPAVVCPSEAEAREQRDEAIRKEVVALGKRYFLLSRHTSLLVLENDAMYATYGVTKGAGDTWAPYAMPATIPVVAAAPAAIPPSVAGDAELVRAPLQVFYSANGHWAGADDDDSPLVMHVIRPPTRPLAITGEASDAGLPLGSLAPTSEALAGPSTMLEQRGTRADAMTDANKGDASVDLPAADATTPVASTSERIDMAGGRAARTDPFATVAPAEHARARRSVAVIGNVIGNVEGDFVAGPGWGVGKAGAWAGVSGQPMMMRLNYPGDPAFDDVTAFVPALVPDAADRWRVRLAAGDDPGRGGHAIDAAARSILGAARRALPSGIYRWGDVELAVDDARRLGWRRTSDAGLAETASLDGATWTRRYAELGLDVTRAVTDDDVAVAFGYLPLWIAEPSHYARWFDVAARGDRMVVLSRRVRGKAQVAFVLQFDDRARLTAIRDGAGTELVEITWAVGPASARVLGEAVPVGFTGDAMADAPGWAHRGAVPGVVVELPAHLPAYGRDRLAAQTAGTPAWRHAERQLMVGLAATADHGGLLQAYDELHRHGGVELGDLALASGAVATLSDTALAANVAPLVREPLARYLIAGRAFAGSQRPDRLGGTRDGIPEGLIASLWSLRAATAYGNAGNARAAVDALAAIGGRAPELSLAGAVALGNRWDFAGADVARMWDMAATGRYRNVARAAAAQALFQRGMYDAAADRVMNLVTELDLAALPPRLGGMKYSFQQARRGQAGWQIAWAAWRDRALAGASYDHVMALLAGAGSEPGDVTPILMRAAELAGGDPARTLAIARAAMARGMGAWAEALLRPLVAAHGSHDGHQLLAGIALQQGRLGDALAELEAAGAAGADDAVDITMVRAELSEILDVARRLAVQSSGPARAQAVERAMAWGRRWRAIDPGNPAIDQQLGELWLAVGDARAAWRQLSSVIDLDPWSGTGYTRIAETFERQGRIREALDYWQQAIVIDQTDPTPRLRKARALLALGRSAEGDALLAEIGHRAWHDQWSGVVEQARELLQRGHSRR